MKLTITHIENIAFNHQVVTAQSDDVLVQIHFKNGKDFLTPDQVGKEFTEFGGIAPGITASVDKVKKGFLGLFNK